MLVWAGLVFAYYFHQQSFSEFLHSFNTFFDLSQTTGAKLAANSLESFNILVCSSLVFLTLWRWGKRSALWLGLRTGNPLLKFCLETALGILFFNGLWLGLGFNGLWEEPLLLGLALFFLGTALWDLSKYVKYIHGPWKKPLFFRLSKLELLLALTGMVFLLFSLFQALSPEVYYDGLVYHLATLRFWQVRHGIADFYTNLYSYYPFGAELYFMNGFFLQGSESAKFLNVLASGLCALAAAGWAAEEGGAMAGCLTFTMVMASPLVSTSVWTTQTDVLLAFFFVLFLHSLMRWGKGTKGKGWAVAAGLLGGAALTVKYTAVVGAASAVLAFFFVRKDMTRRSQDGWLIAGLMAVLLSPWLFKNLLYTGNAFYPYLSHWLGGRTLSPEKFAELMGDHEAVFNGTFSPWGWAHRVLTQDLDKATAPLLISFIPLLFLKNRWGTSARFLGAFSGLYLVLGFLLSHQPRLQIPGFVGCFIFMAVFLSGLSKALWSRAWAGWVVLFAALSFLSLFRLGVMFYLGDQVPFGKQTRQGYLMTGAQTFSYYGLARAATGLLPTSDRLLIAGDARSLYYSQVLYANSVFDDQALVLLAQRKKDADGIRRSLQEMGVDDIVVAGEEGRRLSQQYPYYPLQPAEWAKLGDFIQRWTDPVYLNGLNGLYRLRESPIQRKSPVPDLLPLLSGKSRPISVPIP